jgi:hypothetical protein
MQYDLIGDIHGEAPSLRALLEKLGYEEREPRQFSHPTRKVIFLGDFVDRGKFQREVVEIARNMCDSGTAIAVMGNHEFNAIAFATKFNGQYLREHSTKNIEQHREFLKEFYENTKEYRDAIDWFQTLPLYLELDGLRVVHACWDQSSIDRLKNEHSGSVLTETLLISASDKKCWEYEAIETLLKGKEIPLPAGKGFLDKDDNPRHEIRIKWWDASITTYRQAFLGPSEAITHIPDDPINGDHLIEYSESEVPVFIGHYWLEGVPFLLASNICCLDFSVAKKHEKGPPVGKLCAYRWDGEQQLSADKLVYVDRVNMDGR